MGKIVVVYSNSSLLELWQPQSNMISIKIYIMCQKNNPLAKILYFSKRFGPNFKSFYDSIYTTYFAILIETTDTVQEIQQFKL